MHSDWLVGYIVTYYGTGMIQLVHNRARGNKCSIDICDADSITCHNQNPVDMTEFVQKHPQNVSHVQSREFSVLPELSIEEGYIFYTALHKILVIKYRGNIIVAFTLLNIFHNTNGRFV